MGPSTEPWGTPCHMSWQSYQREGRQEEKSHPPSAEAYWGENVPLKLTVLGGPDGTFSLRTSASWSQVPPHTDQPGQTGAVDCPESNRDIKYNHHNLNFPDLTWPPCPPPTSFMMRMASVRCWGGGYSRILWYSDCSTGFIDSTQLTRRTSSAAM